MSLNDSELRRAVYCLMSGLQYKYTETKNLNPTFANLCYSSATVLKDLEIAVIAKEVLDECQRVRDGIL